MILKNAFTSIIFFTLLVHVSGQHKMDPIDSLYVSVIIDFYEVAEESKDGIWPDMKLAPVCIFRTGGPAFIYKHPNPPECCNQVLADLFICSPGELGLFGSSQKQINGIWTATLDYEAGNHMCPEEGLAVLFHELHHVYQRNFIPELKFDDPVLMLTYPEDDTNDALKLYEQMILYRMCIASDENNFRQLLNQYYSCRKRREAIIGKHSHYEKSVESFEGPALFCEYQFYKSLDDIPEPIKSNYAEKYFFSLLTDPYYGRSGIRKRHIGAGMAMCCILNDRIRGWQTEYYQSGKELFDYFVSKLNPVEVELPEISDFKAMSKYYTNKEREKHRVNLREFLGQSGIKLTLGFASFPQYRGFDPMNAEAVNDSIIIHTTVLSLVNGDDHINIMNYPAITKIEEQVWNVSELVFFLPDNNCMLIKDNRIQINHQGINIDCTGTVEYSNENNIKLFCN